jgi:hypothetical protein
MEWRRQSYEMFEENGSWFFILHAEEGENKEGPFNSERETSKALEVAIDNLVGKETE